MSVLIKGMEMPKTCGECRFSVDGWCYAIASNDDQPGYINPYEKAKWCPIIEIPPHGRLIDADALEVQDGWLRDSKYFAQESSHTHITFVYSNDIYNAPTVIPADKGGET